MKCIFCGDTVPEGKGKMVVKNSGQMIRFCSSKCQKNFELGRDGKKTKWTETYAELKKK